MKDIETKDINAALKIASARAIQLNRALGLSYYEVRKGQLYMVKPDGSSRSIRPAVFGLRKVTTKRIQLKPKDVR